MASSYLQSCCYIPYRLKHRFAKSLMTGGRRNWKSLGWEDPIRKAEATFYLHRKFLAVSGFLV